MGVRPPSDDGADVDVVEFGIAAVDARLDNPEVTFPATATALIEYFGDTEVPYEPGGRTMPVRTAIEQTSRDQFDTRQEFLNELHGVFEQQRERSAGVIGRLRALLPF